jgi:hypothetical protein
MKKNISTICLIILLLAVSFTVGFFATETQAVVPLGFSGHLMWWLPCTCSGSLYLFYAPNVDSSFPGGPLNYAPYATITYSYYNMITPGVWHLGTYLPGVQGCWIIVPHGCAPLPVLGQEVQVGTSMLPTPF